MRLSLRGGRHSLVVEKVMTRRVSVVHDDGHGLGGRGRQQVVVRGRHDMLVRHVG